MKETQAGDPGPMARFEAVIARADTMDEVVARIVDGEHPESLKDIARDWRIPYTRLAQWIVEDGERARRYSDALRFVAETFVHEAVPIADAAIAERDAVAKAKLQIDARKWVASKWDRSKYGESTEVKHTGTVSLVAILSGMPRDRERLTPALDAGPLHAEATGVLPAPAVAVNDEAAEEGII